MPAIMTMEILPEPEGGFSARGVEYGIFTHALTLEELKRNIKEAVELYFDDLPEQPHSIILQHMTISEEVLSW